MHKSGIKLDIICYSEIFLPKESTSSLLLLEEMDRVDGKRHKGNMKKVDSDFKTSNGPQLHQSNIKKRKLEKESVLSDVSYKRAKTLLRKVDDPLSSMLDNCISIQIVKEK